MRTESSAVRPGRASSLHPRPFVLTLIFGARWFEGPKNRLFPCHFVLGVDHHTITATELRCKRLGVVWSNPCLHTVIEARRAAAGLR